MSLDIYLKDPTEHKCICSGCGNEHTAMEDTIVFTNNITHNLNKMAVEAGIYQHLWRPEELNITTAEQLITPLTDGLQRLKDQPDHFKLFNPENEWGGYEELVLFVQSYLDACIEYPNATIEVSR